MSKPKPPVAPTEPELPIVVEIAAPDRVGDLGRWLATHGPLIAAAAVAVGLALQGKYEEAALGIFAALSGGAVLKAKRA